MTWPKSEWGWAGSVWGAFGRCSSGCHVGVGECWGVVWGWVECWGVAWGWVSVGASRGAE